MPTKNKKRKNRHNSNSSSSELDSSMEIEVKQKNKKGKTEESLQTIAEMSEKTQDKDSSLDIKKELQAINKKLSNVITKGDNTLKDLIVETINKLKESLLESVIKRIEILESSLHDSEMEKEKLQKKVEALNNARQSEENQELRETVMLQNEKLNTLEQYSRRNNVIISGIPEEIIISANEVNNQENQSKGCTKFANEKNNQKKESEEAKTSITTKRFSDVLKNTKSSVKMPDNKASNETKETAFEMPEETTKLLIKKLKEKIPSLTISYNDIDIAHRLGKKEDGKARPIIVKFVSRMKRNELLSKRKALFGSSIYINEDLTKLNRHVLGVIKKTASTRRENLGT